MNNFELQICEIYDLDNLETRYNENIKCGAKEIILANDHISYFELYKKHFPQFVSSHELKALEFIAFCYNPSIKENHWGQMQYKYFSEIFGSENVLSVKYHFHNGYLHSHVLVCPIIDNQIQNTWSKDNIIFKEKIDVYQRKMNILFFYSDINFDEEDTSTTNQKYGYVDNETDKELFFDVSKTESNIQTTLPEKEIERIFKETIKYYTTVEFRFYRDTQYGKVDPVQFLNNVEKFLRNKQHVPEEDIPVLLDKMYNAVYEYYVLEKLINDKNISDIKVVAPNRIRVKYQGKRMTTNLKFIDESDYWRFLEGVVIRNHTNLEPINAVQNFTDKYSNENFILRFNICTNLVNSVDYPYLHIRKINKTKYSMTDLMDYGMLDKETANYLIDKVRNGKGFVFSGRGGSGKTSLMNTLIEYIPFYKSGLFLQENEELFSNSHPELMFQHIVTPREEGSISFSLKDLTRNALLCDQDVIGIGEVKGDEALYLINAAMTGAQGWCSVHSYDSASAIDKLADYIKYVSSYPKEECLYMLKELEVLIFMKNFKVYEIKEIAGWDAKNQKLIFKDIYKRPDEYKEL